jgi:hypothetical protein
MGPRPSARGVFVWVMVALAVWHFAVLVPDRFRGGVVGTLVGCWFWGKSSAKENPRP